MKIKKKKRERERKKKMEHGGPKAGTRKKENSYSKMC